MTNLRFSAKQLQIFIKSGQTPEALCQRYQCTEEELRNHIARLYHEKKAKEHYAALEGNRKIARKKANPEEAEETVMGESVTEQQEAMAEEPTTEKDAIAEEEIVAQDVELCTIESLEKEEAHLSRKVIALESEHKHWHTEHRDCIKKLRTIQAELDEVKSHLEKCREDYDRTIGEANNIASTMNRISAIRREKVVALETVRQKLDELRSVTLYVYADGRIEAPDRPSFVLDDEGYLELKKELSDRSECLDLRIRDVQTLARLLKISDNIEGHLTLVCEVAELESAFLAIKGD